MARARPRHEVAQQQVNGVLLVGVRIRVGVQPPQARHLQRNTFALSTSRCQCSETHCDRIQTKEDSCRSIHMRICSESTAVFF